MKNQGDEEEETENTCMYSIQVDLYIHMNELLIKQFFLLQLVVDVE